ncbi:MAG: hypothetical protein ACKOQM_07770 [Novosphingobium sp.]
MTDLDGVGSWIRIVDAILSGERRTAPYVRLGRTPLLLRTYGLGPFDLVMRPGKIAKAAAEHPEIPRTIWHRLPVLLATPAAVLPSSRRDGTVVPVLVLDAFLDDPVLVPIFPDAAGAANVVLSIYEKTDGYRWINAEIARAQKEQLPLFVEKGFVATLPQPGSVSEDTIPSSPGPIPADGTTKPEREILRLRRKSSKD